MSDARVPIPRSLERGLLLLERVVNAREGVSFTRLQEELGWAPMTLSRLLGALRELGYLRQDREGRYWPGNGMAALAARMEDARFLETRGRRVLETLVHETGHSGLLLHWDGRWLHALCRELAPDSVVLSEPGHIVQQPLYHPAMVFCYSPKQWRALRTGVDEPAREWLQREERRLSEEGYTLGHSKARDRVAAPIYREGQVIGAMLLGAFPGHWTARRLQPVAPRLLAACEACGEG